MNIRDHEAWTLWNKSNQDPYGNAIIRYAERWANMMEQQMADGTPVEEVAKATSHLADTEGITGFMYDAAVSVLATCWEHGEQLRRWHNLDTQIGNEGEKANESGGVLFDLAHLRDRTVFDAAKAAWFAAHPAFTGERE